MLRKILPSNKVFESEAFKNDRQKFYLLCQNLGRSTLELFSDEENYIFCRGAENIPTCIWSKDHINTSILKEIESGIRMFINGTKKFDCKRELFEMLQKDNFKPMNNDGFEIGFLLCEKTVEPLITDGYIDRPELEDEETLINFLIDDINNMDGATPIDYVEASREIKELYSSHDFYVWRNNDGKIVCMAGVSRYDSLGKIGHVYTPPEERNNGYASNLVFEMTNKLLKQGVEPLLYTDYNYAKANRVYKKVGYKDKGTLVNFSCDK